jgi:hypothetical protein
MLPFGMDCQEAVEAVAKESELVPAPLLHGATVILSCGSGVTLAGLLRGFTISPHRLVGVSSGRSIKQIEKCIRKYVGEIPNYVELVPAIMPYYESPSINCPFPCHPHYDLKTWQYLSSRLKSYDDPILFWNVGG